MPEYYYGNRWLTLEEMKVNATYIYNKLTAYGWNINSISALLGNTQTESSHNPAIWYNLKENSQSYGLVQWDPASKVLDWLPLNGYSDYDMDGQLERIMYEKENGIQYYPTSKYPVTFDEFIHDNSHSVEWLAQAWVYNYERPRVKPQPARESQARYWYNFLSGLPEPEPEPTDNLKIIPETAEIQSGQSYVMQATYKPEVTTKDYGHIAFKTDKNLAVEWQEYTGNAESGYYGRCMITGRDNGLGMKTVTAYMTNDSTVYDTAVITVTASRAIKKRKMIYYLKRIL